MRHISNKDLNNPPPELTASDVVAHLTAIINTNGTRKPNENFYKGANKEIVVALKELYHNKCAYCEQPTNSPQVEHYRPKGKVQIWIDGHWRKHETHTGYYWLCYEWSNLVPACYSCNRIGDGKSNKFPVFNTHITSPTSAEERTATYLNTTEQPYLLHPEIDYPENYLAFKPTGEITGTDEERRGYMTIKICNLQREDLIVARKTIVDDYVKRIKTALFSLISSRNIATFKTDLRFIINDLIDNQQLHHPYSLVHKYTYENYQTMLINNNSIPIQFRPHIAQLFNELLSPTPNTPA